MGDFLLMGVQRVSVYLINIIILREIFEDVECALSNRRKVGKLKVERLNAKKSGSPKRPEVRNAEMQWHKELRESQRPIESPSIYRPSERQVGEHEGCEESRQRSNVDRHF
jgi:hypothetical protein